MSEVSRRSFLKGGSAAVAAAGAISAIPGLPAVVGALEAQGPADAGAADAAATDAGGSTVLSEPLVAHVRDLATGEIGLFSGAREVTVLDPQLAARLIKAAQ
jgi:TAT (twin-arginine translocation) pathway signal sequence